MVVVTSLAGAPSLVFVCVCVCSVFSDCLYVVWNEIVSRLGLARLLSVSVFVSLLNSESPSLRYYIISWTCVYILCVLLSPCPCIFVFSIIIIIIIILGSLILHHDRLGRFYLFVSLEYKLLFTTPYTSLGEGSFGRRGRRRRRSLQSQSCRYRVLR